MIFEIENTLLIRHFFLETLDEINKELKKINKDFRINIGPQLLSAFKERDEQYIKDYGICNLDGTIDNNKLQTHLQYTKKFITSFSNSKKLYIKPVQVDDNLLSVSLQNYLLTHLIVTKKCCENEYTINKRIVII